MCVIVVIYKVSVIFNIMEVVKRDRILFVDLEIHKNTGSANFFVDLLRRKFDVDICYITSRKDPRIPDRGSVQKYDAVIYWQASPSNMCAMSYDKPSIYVPMYDGESFNVFNWKQRNNAGAMAICFCEKEADFLSKAGFAPLRVKYYPKIKCLASGNPRKLFFWDRIQKILHARGHASFLTLKRLFRTGDLDEIVVRCSKRRSELVSEVDKRDYKITIIPAEKHLSQEEYFAIYSDCGIFSTSRASEGIGMGFLEAMAMGKCVIVNNDATFNEYVRDGISGILIDYRNPDVSREKVEKADIAAIQREAYYQSLEGRRKWEEEYEPRILSFIEDTINEFRPMTICRYMKWWGLVPLKFIFDIRTWVRQKVKTITNR